MKIKESLDKLKQATGDLLNSEYLNLVTEEEDEAFAEFLADQIVKMKVLKKENKI